MYSIENSHIKINKFWKGVSVYRNCQINDESGIWHICYFAKNRLNRSQISVVFLNDLNFIVFVEKKIVPPIEFYRFPLSMKSQNVN